MKQVNKPSRKKSKKKRRPLRRNPVPERSVPLSHYICALRCLWFVAGYTQMYAYTRWINYFTGSAPKRLQFPEVFDKTFIPLTSNNLFTFSHYSFQLALVSSVFLLFALIALESNFVSFSFYFRRFCLVIRCRCFFHSAWLATRLAVRARVWVIHSYTHFYSENVLSS